MMFLRAILLRFLPRWRICALMAAALPLSACVTYLTPGAGAPMQALESGAATTPAAAPGPQPEVQFPARIAIVRVQARDYRSFGADGIDGGDFSVVLAREVETPADFAAVSQWPQVLGVEPLSSLLLPASLQDFGDLRKAAAEAQTDVLFVYTFDTRFHIENQTFKPEQLITLGVLPGREASVSSTAAGAFVDVHSGFVYGSAEGSDTERTLMTKWTKPSSADQTRLAAERGAFAAMMQDAQRSWTRIAAHYSASLNASPEAAAGPAQAGSGDGAEPATSVTGASAAGLAAVPAPPPRTP